MELCDCNLMELLKVIIMLYHRSELKKIKQNGLMKNYYIF